jgi:ABC-type multidrug transport system ATPase subunit/ABC-type multidrug transport system permease subunit
MSELASAEAAVLVEDLVKRFGAFTAVDGISFSVRPGEIFGFLGPNGAGKSTTIRMLCGILTPTAGRGRVIGYDIMTQSENIKEHIGYMSQKFSLYDDLTVEENIEFYGDIYGVPWPRLEERKRWILEMADLEQRARTLTRELATGWKQRLALGCALVHEPRMLFLDEPTAGVDPISRRRFWDLIYTASQQGVTVFVTTHYMDEAEHCDRIGLIYGGKLIALGTPQQLKQRYVAGRLLELHVEPLMQALEVLERGPAVAEVAVFGAALHVVVENEAAERTVRQALARAGVTLHRMGTIVPSLEMIIWKEFIHILRDVRTLAVVVILPVLMLVLYGYAINLDVKHLSLAVLDWDRTPASRDLTGAFSRGEYFDVAAYLTSDRAVTEALDRGRAKAALVIPPGFSSDLASGRKASAQLIVDGSDSTAASTAIGYADAILRQHSANITLAALQKTGLPVRGSYPPVETRVRFWYNPELRSVNYIVPGLIAVILMMLAALLTSMTVVREREQGTIEQLIVSPVRPHELMIGKLLPYVVIAFVDVITVIVAGRLLFHVPLLTAALGIGLLISTLSPSQQTAMTIALVTTMLPAILLSGFVFPISAMPKVVQWLTNIIPARHFLVIARGAFLKGSGLDLLWRPALVLLVFGLVTLALSSLRFRKRM